MDDIYYTLSQEGSQKYEKNLTQLVNTFGRKVSQ